MGKTGLKQFMKELAHACGIREPKDSEVDKAFQALDVDGDGSISPKELYTLVAEMLGQ